MAKAGSTCAASFDWRCSGICNSHIRIMEVHERCAEGENALWSSEVRDKVRELELRVLDPFHKLRRIGVS